MTLPEYETWDATEMAEKVRRSDVSPSELLEASIARIEAKNPELNAVVQKLYDRARARVDSLPDGPLKGVPFLFKDLKLRLDGTPTSNGSKLSKDRVLQGTSELARRYEAAGLQVVGKSNTPEFGIMGITEPAVFGPCRNPHDPNHTPGGSSGGSASAIAAGMVPAAHSGDGGGSIRIPASCCGLFGLKPTRGRVTMAPYMGEAWGGFVQAHAITRSVRDSALFLDVEDPLTPGEPYAAPHKVRPWVEEVQTPPGKLRIAYTPEPLYGIDTHPDCLAALESTVTLLRELGHEVVEATPQIDREAMIRAYFLTVATGVAWFVENTSAAAGKKPRARDYEPGTWLLALIGWATKAPELLDAQVTMQRNARDVAAFFGSHDVFLTPTMARPPAKVGELQVQPSEALQIQALRRLPLKALLSFALEQMGKNKLSWTPNTQLFNQTGQPGMSVPLYTSPSGLPIGSQFVGRFGDEATLFRLAAQLEAARPWTGLAT
jgi:amidase